MSENKPPQKGPSLIDKFIITFLPGDPDKIAHDIWEQDVVPGIKSAVIKAFTSLVNNGTPGRPSAGSVGSASRDRNGNIIYHDSVKPSVIKLSSQKYDYETWTWPTADEPTRICNEVAEHLVRFDGTISVYDLYLIAGKPTNFSMRGSGWKRLENIKPVYENGSFCIKWPRPIELEI